MVVKRNSIIISNYKLRLISCYNSKRGYEAGDREGEEGNNARPQGLELGKRNDIND